VTRKLKKNILEKYSKKILEYLNVVLIIGSELKIYSNQDDFDDAQLCAIARLTLWSGGTLAAIRLYLSRDMVDQAVNALADYQQVRFLDPF
jgi:hypothetical protein